MSATADPVSGTKGIGAFCIKWVGRGVSHLLPSCPEVKERVDLYLYSHYAFVAGCRVNFMLISGYVSFIYLVFMTNVGQREH